MNMSRLTCLFVCVLSCCTAQAGELTVFPMFTDHGILQQDTTVAIWGTAKPGSTVSVTFHEASSKATANPSGKWLARLQTPKAIPGHFDGYDLTISDASESIVLHDVALGEVWIGGGQSNMETPMHRYAVGTAEIPLADHPGIRLYSRGGRDIDGDFSKFKWERCSPEVVKNASATGYFFSRDLHQKLNVPVGFVNMAVGGSPLSAWVKPDWLMADSRTAAYLEAFRATTFPAFIEDRIARLAKWEAMVAEAKAKGEKPNPSWPPVRGAADQPLEAFIGALHVTNTAMVMPFVFKGMIWDQGESGVGYRLKGSYDIIFDIMLQHLREGFGYDLPMVYCQMPKGGAWGPKQHVLVTESAFSEQGDELVPLADLPPKPPKAGPVFDGFAKESETFLRMNALPNCVMATTRDLVAALHPPDKDDYAARFLRVALNQVYGKNVEFFGPMITSAKREGDQIRVSFNYAGSGLTVPSVKPLQGFYITAADGTSTWVSGQVNGNQVILRGPGIETAQTLSYAHTNGGRVLWANLFNLEGLPAYPMTVTIQ